MTGSAQGTSESDDLNSIATQESPSYQPQTLQPLPFGLQWLRRLPSMVLALADQAVVSGANFLHVIAAARCLSMEDFGVFSLAWAVLTFVGNIHQALVLQPLAVLFSEYAPGPARKYLQFLERFHVGLLIAILPLMIAAWMLPNWRDLIIATAIASLMRQAAEHERRVAYVLHDSARALIIDIATYAPLALAALWYWKFPQAINRETVIMAVVLPAALGWIIGRWLLRHARSKGLEVNSPIVLIKQHWSFGKWVLISTLSVYAGTQLYPFLIAGYLGLGEVAALSAARSVIGACNVVISGIEARMTPISRNIYLSQQWPGLIRVLKQTTIFFIVTLLPILLILVTFPEWAINITVGPVYGTHSWIIRWLVILYVILIGNRVFSIALQALKAPRPAALANAIIAGITIWAGPTIVTKFGLLGVLIAMIVNAFIVLTIQIWHLRRVYNNRLKSENYHAAP